MPLPHFFNHTWINSANEYYMTDHDYNMMMKKRTIDKRNKKIERIIQKFKKI